MKINKSQCDCSSQHVVELTGEAELDQSAGLVVISKPHPHTVLMEIQL